LAERVLGKDEVTGSIPVISSNSRLKAGELSTVARSAKVDRQKTSDDSKGLPSI
jgi:hypothetical protein